MAGAPPSDASHDDEMGDLGGFEAALGLPPHTLRAMFDGGDFGTIRLLRYPGGAAAAEARS